MKAATLLLGALLTALPTAHAAAQDYRDRRDGQPKDRDHWRYEPPHRPPRLPGYRLTEPPEVARSYPPDWERPPYRSPADARTVWAYSGNGGGHWQHQGNGKWAQTAGD